MCQPRERQKTVGVGGCNCGCGCGPFSRRFLTAKEKEERMEEYREQLKKELEGLEEHIQEQRK